MRPFLKQLESVKLGPPISIKSPKNFEKWRGNSVENGKNNSPAKALFNSSETNRVSFLNLEVSILSKYFNSVS